MYFIELEVNCTNHSNSANNCSCCSPATRRGTFWFGFTHESIRMNSKAISRIRDTVYVVGAGFSKGLGYPLTKSLLTDVWSRLPDGSRNQLAKIIEFHHPSFKAGQKKTFPDIEQLLTEMAVNLQLFDASRPAEGRFTKHQLRESREILLSTIASWFHELYAPATKVPWLTELVKQMRSENAAVVSFNWDLILDQLLFSGDLDSHSYGLSKKLGAGPLLLKPHGSLNWYEGPQLKHVKDVKKAEIFHRNDASKCVHAFLRPRHVKSKSGKRYTPLIIPPTYFKNFKPSIFKRLWQNCTDVLSTPKRIVFLGYSLPASDLHAHFIFRCGFHNQINGRIKDNATRYPATGAAEVIIVNPEEEAARRIEAVVGPKIPCTWVPKRVQDWVEEDE
jgi:hypothetical protein